MKRIILYSLCIGGLALPLTAGAQQPNDKRVQRARPQPRAATVHAARPTTGAMMGARNYNSRAQYRQPTMTQRSGSNFVANRNARLQSMRERNAARNQAFRERTSAAFNRNRNATVDRTRNLNANRNTNQFRNRNNVTVNRNGNVATNRNRNFAGNNTRNFGYYRGRNVGINNNFHSEAFRGQRYAAFRNYHKQWHDRNWWRSHYNRIVFVNGGWWYWNAGYWFPAWGYAAGAYYPFDGPIYAVNGLPPDQVIADVQQELANDGYYNGPIDGILGPATREAIAAFQADNGLAITSVIDEPTLDSLGIA